jgi:hypothetical protein
MIGSMGGRLRVLCLAIAFQACVGGNCNGSDIPQNDLCTPSDATSTPASIELGVQGSQGEFIPLEDDAVVHGILGGQGILMLELLFRMEGTDLGCVVQTITIDSPFGEGMGSIERSIRVYEQDDGSFISSPFYFLFNVPTPRPGELLRVSVDSGDIGDEASVWFEEVGTIPAPPVLASLTPASNIVTYPDSTDVTLTLGGPQDAPVVVTLFSDGPIDIPDSIEVPANTLTATFTATPQQAPLVFTVRASYQEESVSTTIESQL